MHTSNEQSSKKFNFIDEDFEGPLTFDIMEKPVITEYGQTYENKSIEAWLDKKGTDPNLNVILTNKTLWENKFIKQLIAAYAKGNINNKLFLCPITNKIIKDPVVAADGITYEKEAIKEYLVAHSVSPVTHETITDKSLRENFLAKSLIEKHVKATRVKKMIADITVKGGGDFNTNPETINKKEARN